MSIGCGILALPYASNQCGIVLALLINFIVAAMNGISCDMMVECKNNVNFDLIPNHISSIYARVSYAAFGYSNLIHVKLCANNVKFICH
jgi:amino acid permease